MEAAEQCYRAMYSFGAGYNDPDGHNLDRNVRLMQREHFAELWLLGALRRHPQRTHVPSEAGLFFIGYAPCLGKFAHPCEGVPPKVGCLDSCWSNWCFRAGELTCPALPGRMGG